MLVFVRIQKEKSIEIEKGTVKKKQKQKKTKEWWRVKTIMWNAALGREIKREERGGCINALGYT